ncbi:MAG: ABC transporter ATP-binding protein [Oscillospiraceae bacterium]|nr:ABC transporter ATP-binding protein [Oscillospiraceae bacterium]
MKLLDVTGLSVRLGGRDIVKNVSFSVSEGDWLMIVGPNGAGKSTIVNAVSQGVPYTGTILFQGRDVRTFKPHQLARHIGVLSQNHAVGYAFSVEEVVRLGRYAYAPGVFSARTDADEDAVAEALRLTGLSEVASQSVLTLSGGELQRAFLAQLFAQDPEVLILDEPTNHLDLVYQKQIFSLIEQWRWQPGRAVVSVVHDLSLAMLCGNGAVLLDRGSVAASGAVREVLTAQRLQAVYAMDVKGWMQGLLRQWEEV